MQILFSSQHFEIDQKLREHIERRIHFCLARFGDRIVRARVRIAGVNDLHGVGAKNFSIEIYLRPSDRVFLQDTGFNLSASIERVIERAGRTVARRMENIRSERQGKPPIILDDQNWREENRQDE